MVHHERVANNVYAFQSEVYAQVTAGVLAGPDMAVVIDTLAFPEETLEMRAFIEQELQVPVRYLINTHYHADHSWGNIFFPGAIVVAHTLCHKMLKEKGIPSLEAEKQDNPTFKGVEIVLPHVTFDEGEMVIQLGKKKLRLFPLPGHSADSIAVLVEEDRVLFAGDTVMPIPFLADGDIDDTTNSFKKVAKLGLENIVQGHGEIILRGEIERALKSNLDYLNEIRKAVKQAARRKFPLDLLETFDVETCGKSRVLLGGLAEQLHQQNLRAIYEQLIGEAPVGSEEYYLAD